MATERDEIFDAVPAGTRWRILGLIAGALALVLILVGLLSGGGAELFHRKFRIRTLMADATGLEKDADVMLNGVRVGRTVGVALSGQMNPNRVVRVEMEIQDQYLDLIPSDSITALTADNLLGDKYVNIAAGKSPRHVQPGDELASLATTGGFNPADLFASLQSTLRSVDALLTEIESGNSQLARLVRTDDFYNGMVSQITAIQNTISDMVDPKSEVGRMFFTDEVYNSIRQQALQLDASLAKIQRGEGQAGKLFTDSGPYDRTVQKVSQLRSNLADVNAGKNSAGRFLKSDEQYAKIRAQIRKIDQDIDQLTTGNGAIAKAYQSRELYDSLNAPSKKTAAFLKDFRENPRKYERVQLRHKKPKQAPATPGPAPVPQP